jgi:hypothetical protein
MNNKSLMSVEDILDGFFTYSLERSQAVDEIGRLIDYVVGDACPKLILQSKKDGGGKVEICEACYKTEQYCDCIKYIPTLDEQHQRRDEVLGLTKEADGTTK